MLTSIAVTTKPSKLSYTEGESFDKSGMIVTAYYNNNLSEAVSNYTVSGYSSTIGTKTITVSYNGKTATFDVTVNAKPTEPEPKPEPKPEPEPTPTPTPTIVKGDANLDGKITITDMLSVKAHLLQKSSLSDNAAKAADTNGDGKITITDFIQIKAHLLGKSNLQ